MKASNTQRESGKFSDDPGRLGEKSYGIQKKHREKEESSGKSRGTPEKREAFWRHRENVENFRKVW